VACCRVCDFIGLDFTGLPFDVAFRYLLTNGGFFLPGEAQKIDRITQVESNVVSPVDRCLNRGFSPQAFARAYCEMNSIDDIPASDITEPRLYRPSNSDVAEVLTFSLIMLHTDAHNPNIKKEKKMTMAQFVSNNRCGNAAWSLPLVISDEFLRCSGIDGGKDLPRDFLEYLYNATVSHEIKMLPGAGGNGESIMESNFSVSRSLNFDSTSVV
jgi:cytohesin